MIHFPVVVNIEVQFRDLDTLGHVNNAVFLSYLEAARLEYLRRLGGLPALPSLVVARIEIDFLKPVFLGQTVAIGARVSQIGGKSFRMDHLIWAGEEVVCRVHSVLVWTQNDQPIRVPDSIRQQIAQLEDNPALGSGA